MEFDTPPLETSEAASSTTSVAELAGVRPKLRKTLQELGLTSADMTWSAYAWGWSQLILTAVIVRDAHRNHTTLDRVWNRPTSGCVYVCVV